MSLHLPNTISPQIYQQDVHDTEKRIKELENEQSRLTREIDENMKLNGKLEEKIAEFLRYVREGEKEKAWVR